MSWSPLYYRPISYVNKKEDKAYISSVCMQDFDECDYDQKAFLNEIQYESEEECDKFCESCIERLESKNHDLLTLIEKGFTGKMICKLLFAKSTQIEVYWKGGDRYVKHNDEELLWEEFVIETLFDSALRFKVTIEEVG